MPAACGKFWHVCARCPTFLGMRNFARLCIAGVAVACSALLLSGCVQPGPVVTPAATSSSKPLFASDEDALAAATKAYAAYLQMSDLIAQESGANPERLAPLVTSKWLQNQVAAFGKFAKSGSHQDGTTSFKVSRLQQVLEGERGQTTVVIYVCTDLSSAQILNSSNIDVTPIGVQKVVPFLETFITSSDHGGSLVLSEDTAWTGKNFC
jgi:hypothetical protein